MNVSPQQLAALRSLDSCTVCNAIESFEIRLRNEGFASGYIQCLFPILLPMVGYATTAQIRCSGPPPDSRTWFERTDWWDHIVSIPAPRVVVIQDLDAQPGSGALVGEVHANIFIALGCAGAVTNGAIRDLAAVQALQFPCFARHPIVSHSYAHIVSIGTPVEIGGLKVKPGDLLHGDRNGVLSIPLEIAEKLPAAAARIAEHERKLISFCRSADFSPEQLRRLLCE